MIYCSMDITGTDADFKRAEALRYQLAAVGKPAVLPLLLFREQLVLLGDMHDEIVKFTIHLMEGCDEVRLYDSPATSVTCARDKELGLRMGKPVIEVFANKTLHERELSEIMQHYQFRLCGFPPRKSLEDVAGYLNSGMDSKVICRAIDIGVERQKPWNYINGILRNLYNEGIFTEEQLKNRNNKKAAEGNKKMQTFDIDLFNRVFEDLPE